MSVSLPGLHKIRQSFKYQGVIGAHLQAKHSPEHSPHHNGDCILLDFQNLFFGISDSSDRDPGASKRFLVQYGAMLASVEPAPRRVTLTGSEGFNQWNDDLILKTNNLIQKMKGRGTCTFTGLQIHNTANHTVGMLMHTGDSSLYEYIPSQEKIFPKTEKNFWMVGKTDRLYQVSMLEFTSESILILMTDGIADLHDVSTSAPKEKIKNILLQNQVEDIPMQIIAHETPDFGLNDDAAVIALTPRLLNASNQKILIEN